MRKVQTVINIVFIVQFLLHHSLYGQDVFNGKYIYTDGTQSFFKTYEFDELGIFKFKSGNDTGISSYGKGHYFINKDSLTLNYDLTELKHESYHKEKKYFNTNDSLQITLKVYDFEKEPISNTSIYSFPQYKSINTDNNGEATLRFSKSDIKESFKLHIEAPFFAKHTILLDTNANYDIVVFMNASEVIGFSHPRAIKDETVRYKIEKIDKTEITLSNEKLGSFKLIKSKQEKTQN